MTRDRLRGDAGSVTAELVVITPAALVLLCLVAFVGRTTAARSIVSEAARDAARAGSIQRDPGTAERAARLAGGDALTSGGTRCVATSVAVDLGGFGPGDDVTVTVTCDISLSDLGLIGLSGTRSISGTAHAIVDVYRGTR